LTTTASKKQMSEHNYRSREIQEELDALAPNLSKVKKNHPYSIPDGYFEALSNNASVIAQDMGVQRTPIIRRLINVRSVAAAASVIIIGLLVWLNHLDSGHQDLAAVSVDEMIEYLEEEGTLGINEEELVDELLHGEAIFIVGELHEDLSAEVTVEAEELIDGIEDEVTAEDIIDYLLEDNIDLETIVDEL